MCHKKSFDQQILCIKIQKSLLKKIENKLGLSCAKLRAQILVLAEVYTDNLSKFWTRVQFALATFPSGLCEG